MVHGGCFYVRNVFGFLPIVPGALTLKILYYIMNKMLHGGAISLPRLDLSKRQAVHSLPF